MRNKKGQFTNGHSFRKNQNYYGFCEDIVIFNTIKGDFIIDLDDFEKVNKYNWSINDAGYVWCSSRKIGFLHRFILNLKNKEVMIDHIDRSPLNNRKNNLRMSTKSTNGMNRLKPISNTSGYKGVSFRQDRNKYRAYITLQQKTLHLGHYDTAIEAALAYNNAAILYHKEFAVLNEVSK